MKLDIIPIHEDGFDCFDDLFITVAKWLNRDYEMSLLYSWNFSIQVNDGINSDLIASKYFVSAEKQLECLSKYHGIETIYRKVEDSETSLLEIQKCIHHKLPVILDTDVYYLPWYGDEYRRYHSRHTCLAIGFNDANLYCVDSIPLMHGSDLPISDYKQGAKGMYVFNIKGSNEISFDSANIFSEVAKELYKNDEYGNMFDRLRLFSAAIKTELNIDAELHGYERIWDAPFFRLISYIRNSRFKFLKCIKYIEEKSDTSGLNELVVDFEALVSSWSTVRGMLFKSRVSANKKDIIERVADKISDIVNEEERLANKLISISSRNNNNLAAQNKNAGLRHSKTEKNTMLTLSLENYFSSNGIGTAVSNDCPADITGFGTYLLADDAMKTSLWRVDSMVFKFPVISQGENDNISCNKQVIPVDSIQCTSIMFLGCAEWGSFYEKLHLEYDNGDTEDIMITFSDWFSEPQNGEIVAWRGNTVQKMNDDLRFDNSGNYRIIAKEYPLSSNGNLVKIILPQCENIHIFAITLGI